MQRRPTDPTHAPSASPALTASEQAVLRVFSDFRIAPGEMFCFTGPVLEKHQASLDRLVAKDLAVKESFASGYSLTAGGYRAMIASCRP